MNRFHVVKLNVSRFNVKHVESSKHNTFNGESKFVFEIKTIKVFYSL